MTYNLKAGQWYTMRMVEMTVTIEITSTNAAETSVRTRNSINPGNVIGFLYQTDELLSVLARYGATLIA